MALQNTNFVKLSDFLPLPHSKLTGFNMITLLFSTQLDMMGGVCPKGPTSPISPVKKTAGVSSVVCSERGSEMALNGQVAAVTGAAMGIGRAITEILLQNGAKVQFGLILQNYLSGLLF